MLLTMSKTLQTVATEVTRLTCSQNERTLMPSGPVHNNVKDLSNTSFPNQNSPNLKPARYIKLTNPAEAARTPNQVIHGTKWRLPVVHQFPSLSPLTSPDQSSLPMTPRGIGSLGRQVSYEEYQKTCGQSKHNP